MGFPLHKLINGRKTWVTSVYTHINGVITLLITARSPLCNTLRIQTPPYSRIDVPILSPRIGLDRRNPCLRTYQRILRVYSKFQGKMIDDTPCAFNIAKEKIGKKKPQKKGLFSKQIKDYQNDSPLELLITNHYENQ